MRRSQDDNLETVNTNVSTEIFYMVHFNAITQTFENHLHLDTKVYFKLIKRSKPVSLVGQHHVVSALERQLQGFIRLTCKIIPPVSPEIKARLTRWGNPTCSSSRRPGQWNLSTESSRSENSWMWVVKSIKEARSVHCERTSWVSETLV